MLYKRCSRCGNRLAYNSVCRCKARYKTNSDAYKSPEEKKFYKSRAWQSMTDIVKSKFNFIDIYSYYILNKIEVGKVVHHIIPLDEDFNKRLSLDNLIYLTEKNHRTIHNLMKKSPEDKEYVQQLLLALIEKFNTDFKYDRGV